MTTNPLPLAAVRAIKEEAEKATQGPWLWIGPLDDPYGDIHVQAGTRGICNLWQDDAPVRDFNAEQSHNSYFIAHARTNVPALCNLVDTLVEALRKYGQHLDSCALNAPDFCDDGTLYRLHFQRDHEGKLKRCHMTRFCQSR